MSQLSKQSGNNQILAILPFKLKSYGQLHYKIWLMFAILNINFNVLTFVLTKCDLKIHLLYL